MDDDEEGPGGIECAIGWLKNLNADQNEKVRVRVYAEFVSEGPRGTNSN